MNKNMKNNQNKRTLKERNTKKIQTIYKFIKKHSLKMLH